MKLLSELKSLSIIQLRDELEKNNKETISLYLAKKDDVHGYFLSILFGVLFFLDYFFIEKSPLLLFLSGPLILGGIYFYMPVYRHNKEIDAEIRKARRREEYIKELIEKKKNS